MSLVLQLAKILTERPDLPQPPGVSLRHFDGQDDIDLWLELRHRAFAREKVGVGSWTQCDFERELLAKSWWSPDRLWLAEATSVAEMRPGLEIRPELIGAVALASRGVGPDATPAIHWLMVAPRWRRRGIARLLVAAVERRAWDAGHREIRLETHAAWTAAARLYAALGYHPVRGA